MKRLEISVPSYNDSLTRIILSGQTYFLRFTYNDTYDYWSLGIYDWEEKVLVSGIRMVPRFPLNLFCPDFPQGVLAVFTDQDRINQNSFQQEKAILAYVTEED